MFENTAALLAGLGIQHLHVFPYSPRPGTPAARMPQVPADIRKARAARLRAIGAANLDAWLAGRVGQPDRVLIEADDAGRGESFAPIALEPGHSAEPGAVVPVTVLGVEAGRLIGRPLLRAAA
jgi:threonylcarbamoyladenosine tRNA methylthiotransferase MtaB